MNHSNLNHIKENRVSSSWRMSAPISYLLYHSAGCSWTLMFGTSSSWTGGAKESTDLLGWNRFAALTPIYLSRPS